MPALFRFLQSPLNNSNLFPPGPGAVPESNGTYRRSGPRFLHSALGYVIIGP